MTARPNGSLSLANEIFLNGKVILNCGDSLHFLKDQPENRYDSCVCDPPYALVSIVKRFGGKNAAACIVPEGGTGAYARASAGFMGKQWDTGDTAHAVEFWAEVLRVLKPGGYVLAFGSTRTYHRLACAIEDAGFEIRDMVSWMYGSGFPKSHDVSKGIDRAAGAEREIIGQQVLSGNSRVLSGNKASHDGDWNKGARSIDSIALTIPATAAAKQWEGWGTALKPACEPICMARKPLSEKTVAANVLKWGTGALNIDGCRVEGNAQPFGNGSGRHCGQYGGGGNKSHDRGEWLPVKNGRWPANVIHDGSEEVLAGFPNSKGAMGAVKGTEKPKKGTPVFGDYGLRPAQDVRGDTGSAARFFASFPIEDGTCLSQKHANDAARDLSLQNEAVASALSNAVALSTPRLALRKKSYRAQNTSVSGQQLRLIAASVTEAIQNIERRCLLGLPRERLSVRLGPVTCVAIPKQIGITTITVDLSTLNLSAEAVTFDIIEMSEEAGGAGFAKRFHYAAKADALDRAGSKHPTVKPIDLMQYLVRLVTPKGGLVLDPFAGTGTTAEAAYREGMSCVLIERETEYQDDIRRRMALVMAGPDEQRRESIKAKTKDKPADAGPLFGGTDAI